jgi:hypothetical protein
MTSRWPTLRILFTAHGSFTLIVWLVLVAVSAAVTLGIATWGNVDQSVWHYCATQAVRWFALGLGLDAVNTYLRLHIAHGRTRRDFLRQLWPYLGALAALLALLVTVTYPVERGVYALADWRHRLVPPVTPGTESLFGLFGAFTLLFLLWAVAGVMIAAAFTRNALLGVVAVLVGVLIAVPGELLLGVQGIPLFVDALAELEFTPLTNTGVGVGALVVGCAAIWGIVRDMPVRPRVA